MAKRGGTHADVIRFLRAVDARIEAESHEVWISGGAAVLLAYGGELATVDVDFVGERRGVLLQLVNVATKDSEIHNATNLYTDVVPPGLFLSEFGWRNRAISVTVPGLTHLRLRVLEIHDLVLSKLKRFSAKDRNDIRHLVGRPEVDQHVLVERYRGARMLLDYDEREKIDRNFNLVETDFLGLEATPFD